MENVIKCDVCGKEMKKKKVDEKIEIDDRTIILKGIEAYVCDECENEILEEKEISMMEKLINIIRESKNDISVLNLDETASLLRVSNQTIYNMIKDGRLKAYKVGREWRFMKKDIESFLYSTESTIAAKGGKGENDDIKKIRKRLEIDEGVYDE